jgi:hypothetical protein
LEGNGFSLPGQDDCTVKQHISYTRHIRKCNQDFKYNGPNISLNLHYKQVSHSMALSAINATVEAVKEPFMFRIGMVCTTEEEDF